MSRITVLALVDSLSNHQASQAACSSYYDECVLEQAQEDTFARVRVRPVTAEAGTITFPADVVNVFHVLYDTRPLPAVALKQLEARNPQWRDEIGTPMAYTTQLETTNTLRLYPKPAVASGAQSFDFGEPLGRDFPIGSVTLVCTTTEELPYWFDLPLALKVLAKEFARESDHRDMKFVQACMALYQVCALLAIGEL